MKKSNKIRKKTLSDISIINYMKTYINKYSATVNYVRNIEFEEQADENSMRFICKLDCGSFEQRIIYYPNILLEEYIIDTEFSFDNSSYIYSFYDIFNFFDIDDFNLYFYKNMLSFEDVEHAVKEIFSATEKYLYYIKKAETPEYIHELEKNYEMDMISVCRTDCWKDVELNLLGMPLNHPFYSIADGQITAKMHKKLQKKYAKGKLDSIYEKRLLKYLDDGNNFERKSISEKNDFEKLYRKREIQLSLCIFLIILTAEILLSLIIHGVVFYGAEIIRETDVFLSLFPKNMFVLCITAAALTTLAVLPVLGKKLLIKLMPDDLKHNTERKYEKDSYGSFEKISKPVKIVLCIPLIIISFFALVSSVDDIGFYDDHLRFSNGVTLKISDIQYEDLKIYKVLNVYTTEGGLKRIENTYAVAGENGIYYELGRIDEQSKLNKKLFEIAEQYNIEIAEINSIEDLA